MKIRRLSQILKREWRILPFRFLLFQSISCFPNGLLQVSYGNPVNHLEAVFGRIQTSAIVYRAVVAGRWIGKAPVDGNMDLIRSRFTDNSSCISKRDSRARKNLNSASCICNHFSDRLRPIADARCLTAGKNPGDMKLGK